MWWISRTKSSPKIFLSVKGFRLPSIFNYASDLLFWYAFVFSCFLFQLVLDLLLKENYCYISCFVFVNVMSSLINTIRLVCVHIIYISINSTFSFAREIVRVLFILYSFAFSNVNIHVNRSFLWHPLVSPQFWILLLLQGLSLFQDRILLTSWSKKKYQRSWNMTNQRLWSFVFFGKHVCYLLTIAYLTKKRLRFW